MRSGASSGSFPLEDETPGREPVLSVTGSQETRVALAEVRRAYLSLNEEHREVLLLVVIEGLGTKRRRRSSRSRLVRCGLGCQGHARRCVRRSIRRGVRRDPGKRSAESQHG